jgi:hypothetical protein
MAEGSRLVLLDRPAGDPGATDIREVYTRGSEVPAPSLWLIAGADGTVNVGSGLPAWFGAPVGC